MEIKTINAEISVAPQITPDEVQKLADQGFRALICNRPDGEAADQPNFSEIEAAAKKAGLEIRNLPIVSGKVSDQDAADFGAAMQELPRPILAYCRTGTRSATLWSLSQANRMSVADILAATKAAGYDMGGVVRRIANGGKTPTDRADASYDIVIVGGGAAGLAVAASLKSRKSSLDIAVIDPADIHYYQPGWTMVGGGIFEASDTAKTMGSLIPRGVTWIKSAVAAFEPKDDAVILDGCRVVKYKRLIVAPGLKLAWDRVEGLEATLGKNGVTSNYRYDLAPYTWNLVKNMKEQLPKYFGFEAAGILLRDVKTDFIFTIYELSKDETRKALLQKFKQQEINKRKKLLQKQNKASSEAHNFLETAEYEEREQNYLDQIQ